MAYRVELAKNTEAELEELYLWVVERAPSQGAAWFNGLERAILSLEQLPKRCRIALRASTRINQFESSTTAAAPTFTACSSRSMRPLRSCALCTFGVARGKGRHRVSSKASSALAGVWRLLAFQQRDFDSGRDVDVDEAIG